MQAAIVSWHFYDIAYDEHLRLQARCDQPDGVDSIVSMQHLNSFFASQFNIRHVPRHDAVKVPKTLLSRAHIDRARCLHQEDHTIRPACLGPPHD